MNNFKDFYHLITEVRVLNPIYLDSDEPLRDTDTIRVYHGFGDVDDALHVAKYGMSGDMRVSRTYSYENNNNPKGLFVTIDFKTTAKYFAHPRYSDNVSVIMALNVKAKDLEAPVWPDGTYTVQGGMTKSWGSEEEREEYIRSQKEINSKDERDFIRNSDDPSLAKMLLSGESQALYRGNLNPNMISEFWVSTESYNKNKSFKRYNRGQFLKEFWVDKKYTELSDRNKAVTHKLYNPNDDFTVESFYKKISERYKNFIKPEDTPHSVIQQLIRVYGDSMEGFPRLLWPKQLKQLKIILDSGLFQPQKV